jgi:hypothetical protein
MTPKVILHWWCAMTVAFVIHTVFPAGYVEICKLVAVRCTGTQDEREFASCIKPTQTHFLMSFFIYIFIEIFTTFPGGMRSALMSTSRELVQ